MDGAVGVAVEGARPSPPPGRVDDDDDGGLLYCDVDWQLWAGQGRCY